MCLRRTCRHDQGARAEIVNFLAGRDKHIAQAELAMEIYKQIVVLAAGKGRQQLAACYQENRGFAEWSAQFRVHRALPASAKSGTGRPLSKAKRRFIDSWQGLIDAIILPHSTRISCEYVGNTVGNKKAQGVNF